LREKLKRRQKKFRHHKDTGLIRQSYPFLMIRDLVIGKKVTHKEGYRIRVGNYRILYTVDDETRTVVIYRIKIKGKNTYR